MLVCQCNGVSDRTVRRAVREGAATVAEVGHACGAGVCCQGCGPLIGKIIRIERRRTAKAETSVASGAAPATP